MNKHGKKKRRNYWIDIILLDILAASMVSILLLCNMLKTPTTYPNITWEVVKNEDKDYNKHILTQEDLSQLYTLKTDGRLINTQILEFTYEDAQILLKVGRAEGGPTLLGQLWAIRTIINRVQSSEFPNTIWEVVSQREPSVQFDVVETGKWEEADINSNTHVALAMVESGWNKTQGALYWEATTNTEHSWHATHLEFIAEIEGNRYYK